MNTVSCETQKMVNHDSEFDNFLVSLSRLKSDYHTGNYLGKRYGVTISRPVMEKITKLFAQELGGSNIVSFNIFFTNDKRAVLKPCEMSSRKVIDFVVHFELE